MNDSSNRFSKPIAKGPIVKGALAWLLDTAGRMHRDERGVIALMFALMLPVLIGMVALGVETGLWFKDKRELQTIADAAAVSAAIENAYGATSSELQAAAQLEANNNGFDATSDTITYVGAPTSGAYVGDSGYIEVTVTRQLDTILSQVLYSLDPVATARAVASTTGDQEACVLALSSSAMNSVYVNGAGSTVSMEGCSVVANSTHSTKSVNVQNGTLDIDCVQAAGGVSGTENMNLDCAAPTSGAGTADDPYEDLAVPSFSGCGWSGNGNSAYSSDDEDDGTLDPGVYCGGLSISSSDTIHMNDGTYIIDSGDFTVNGGATVTGSNVTIILTSSGSTYGKISINGGGTVNLSAPTSGDYAGVLLYQDREAGTSSSLNSTINGGSEVELGGAVYLPKNDLSFTGGNSADSNGCLLLVAQSVSFNGNADIENNCDMYGGNPITFGARPGLVE